MYSSFVQHILEVCKTLNNYGVQYLIIGGTAVGFHGHYRDTTDSNGKPFGKHDFDFGSTHPLKIIITSSNR